MDFFKRVRIYKNKGSRGGFLVHRGMRDRKNKGFSCGEGLREVFFGGFHRQTIIKLFAAFQTAALFLGCPKTGRHILNRRLLASFLTVDKLS